MSSSSSSVRVLCHCTGRCGGPDGDGKLWSISTVYKHKKADRNVIEAARHTLIAPTSKKQSNQVTGGVGTRDDEGAEIMMNLDDGDDAEPNRDDLLLMGGETVHHLCINMLFTDLLLLG